MNAHFCRFYPPWKSCLNVLNRFVDFNWKIWFFAILGLVFCRRVKCFCVHLLLKDFINFNFIPSIKIHHEPFTSLFSPFSFCAHEQASQLLLFFPSLNDAHFFDIVYVDILDWRIFLCFATFTNAYNRAANHPQIKLLYMTMGEIFPA